MFTFPKLIEQKTSKYNGNIKVFKLLGKYSLVVDNLTQSGGLLVPIWKRALKFASKNFQLNPKSCLVIGLGGGSVAHIVAQAWPQADITGIDIDPMMINLGKKYFSLNKIKHLKIITADAFKHIYGLRSGIYDLILVDTYQGKTYPPKAQSQKFTRQLKALLSPRGFVVFNRLNWDNNAKDISAHITLLKTVFPHLTHKKILSNTIIFCPKD